MTDKQMRAALIAACKAAGSQKAFCQSHGLSTAYVSDVIHARRTPIAKSRLLVALKLRAVTTYEDVSP